MKVPYQELGELQIPIFLLEASQVKDAKKLGRLAVLKS